ncbi:protein NCBP2AS2 homolog [Penaeus vannamei]|uniref:protein NCBP2AS2 homolog n=1 Tax=Penaeus vannamei TaxID=6689 RepID=UPI00387F97C6
MVLRYLLSRILNNPEVIEKLSESYPIRRAAQITAYALQRGKVAASEALDSEASKRLQQFRQDFTHEVKEGFKKIEEESKTKNMPEGAADTVQTDAEKSTEEKKPKCKACCACPETKRARDACIIENGEENCTELIEAHKKCLKQTSLVINVSLGYDW